MLTTLLIVFLIRKFLKSTSPHYQWVKSIHITRKDGKSFFSTVNLKRCFSKISACLFFIPVFTMAKAQVPDADTSGNSGMNPVISAAQFLRIAADARSGAMGDAGIATAPDANAVFMNTAKLAFAEKKTGFAVSYAPWMHELTDDMHFTSLACFHRIDDGQSLSFGLRYVSYGKVSFTSVNGSPNGDFSPQEFAVEGGYARKLSNHFSTGLNLGFIFSNLASNFSVNNIPITSGKAVKADLSFFYSHKANFGKTKGSYNIGATIANIGNKISYTSSAGNKDFLPTNLGLGGNLRFQFNDYNSLSFTLDLNKLLVPTSPNPSDESAVDDYYHKSVVEGIFTSFSDAPSGFTEELREVTISTGAEYWFKDIFSLRAGYFFEDKSKGDRQYLTAGLGVRYHVFGLNFSYLIPTSVQNDPLENTLRFSLLFDFDSLGKKNEEVSAAD